YNDNMIFIVVQYMVSQSAYNIGVVRPEGQNVDTNESSPIISESNMPSSPYSQKVCILLKDGFSSKELTDTMKFLTEKGVFIEVISDKLGILKGDDETEIIVDKGF